MGFAYDNRLRKQHRNIYFTLMATVKTNAWTLRKGKDPACLGLIHDTIEFEFSSDDDVLAEPIYGCWEGNMQHAVDRDPIDICGARGEEFVVLGNSGVVRVLDIGKNVSNCKVGDFCLVFCNSNPDQYGYPTNIYGYDAPNTIGLLAKKTKLHKSNLIPIPKNTRFSLQQWASFSLRFITAWANWKVAFKCWRSQMETALEANEFVLAWGGGVSLAELILAKHYGFNTAMITSMQERIQLIEGKGITAIDRSLFPNLCYDPEAYANDHAYKLRYKESEDVFLDTINQVTNGRGVAIFIDNIGLSVYRATLKALSRQGVIATSGWKSGMELTTLRAIETINRRIHVHTHYANYEEALEAIDFAEKFSWMPQNGYAKDIFEWDNIPELVGRYGRNAIADFFPLFEINRP